MAKRSYEERAAWAETTARSYRVAAEWHAKRMAAGVEPLESARRKKMFDRSAALMEAEAAKWRSLAAALAA